MSKAELSQHVPELNALQLLLEVARLGSLGRAAGALGISQPAASGRIRAMERQLGVTLLDRSPQGSQLTESGVLITDWARKIVESAQEFDAGVRALRDQQESRLVVAASMTIAEYLLPGWLIALHSERPDTAVALLADNSSAVPARIRSGEADLGFVEGLAKPSGLDSAVIGVDRLLVVAAPGHRWARRRKPVEIAELADTPLLLREPGSGTREVLDHALAPYDGPAAALLELNSTTAVKSAAISGAGPSVLSEFAVREELSSRRLVEVPVTDVDLRREFRAVWLRGARPAGPARDLLAITRRYRARSPQSGHAAEGRAAPRRR